MNDPRVESLEYRLETDPTLIFESPPPLECDTRDFKLRLDDGRLLVTMRIDCATEEVARQAVEPLLRAWELDYALQQFKGRRELRFTFQRADVIDRKPTPGAPSLVLLAGVATLEMVAHATLTVSRRSYPPPPATFVVSPDVETLWNRYQGYVLGHEPLPAMGYFCWTVVEWRFRGLPKAAKALHVSKLVFQRFRQLTSARGDPAQVRKWTGAPLPPLTPVEVRWIDETLRAMIRRLAIFDAGQPPAATLTMADLPTL